MIQVQLFYILAVAAVDTPRLLVQQPWHWGISGALIALTMTVLIYFGKYFGLSSTYSTMCAIGGAGQRISFFDFNWREQVWNLLFVAGVIMGGFLSRNYLVAAAPLSLSSETAAHLAELGINIPYSYSDPAAFLPVKFYSLAGLSSLKGAIVLIIGGFISGFGARWAGGCTSGHFTSGLSNLQLPSLITVIFFFIGGIVSTNLLLPLILSL